MQTDFSRTLQHITANTPLKTSLLYGLSTMNNQNLQEFKTVWPTIEPRRRQAIMETLVSITEQNFEVNFDPVFLLGLDDADAEVQIAAIHGLWESESPALIPLFIRLMKAGQTAGVRAAAASALGLFMYLNELEELDDAAAMTVEQALLETIRRPNEDIEVVRRAIESIAYSHREGIDSIIENAYYHENERMRVSAIFAMGRTFNQARWKDIVIAELNNRNPEIRFEAARACGELSLEEAVAPLIRLIETEPEAEIRYHAIWSLGQIGGPVAQETLETLTLSEDDAIREAAEDALDELLLLSGVLEDMFDFSPDQENDEMWDEWDDYLDGPDDDYQTYRLN